MYNEGKKLRYNVQRHIHTEIVILEYRENTKNFTSSILKLSHDKLGNSTKYTEWNWSKYMNSNSGKNAIMTEKLGKLKIRKTKFDRCRDKR